MYNMNGNDWRCEKCNLSYDHCIRRYILSVTAQDNTGQAWFSLFNDTAEQLLGHSADSLYNMKCNGDIHNYESIFSEALFKMHLMRIRVKNEPFEGAMKLKSTIVRIENIDYVAESEQLYNAIQKYF